MLKSFLIPNKFFIVYQELFASLLSHVTSKTLSVLAQNLENHPDLVEDYFDLCARYLIHCPEILLQEANTPHIIQCAIIGITIQHHHASTSIYMFLAEFLGASLDVPKYNARRRSVPKAHHQQIVFTILDRCIQQMVNQLFGVLTGSLGVERCKNTHMIKCWDALLHCKQASIQPIIKEAITPLSRDPDFPPKEIEHLMDCLIGVGPGAGQEFVNARNGSRASGRRTGSGTSNYDPFFNHLSLGLMRFANVYRQTHRH